MIKSEKEQVVRELNEKFSRAKAAILSEFSKVNVETVNQLRKKLRDGGVEYRVLKNTLAKRAAKGTALEALAEQFKGSVSITLGYDDVVQPAKLFSDFVKDSQSFKVRGAIIDGKLVDASGVQALAKLPGLPELRAKLLGLINQPAGKVVRTIAEPAGALVRVIKARSEKS